MCYSEIWHILLRTVGNCKSLVIESSLLVLAMEPESLYLERTMTKCWLEHQLNNKAGTGYWWCHWQANQFTTSVLFSKIYGMSLTSLYERALCVGFCGQQLHSMGSTEIYNMAIYSFWNFSKTSANTGKQLKSYSGALFYCKSGSGNNGSCHQHSLTTGAFFEILFWSWWAIQPNIDTSILRRRMPFCGQDLVANWSWEHKYVAFSNGSRGKNNKLYPIDTRSLEWDLLVRSQERGRKWFIYTQSNFIMQGISI